MPNSRNELSPHVEALLDTFVPEHIRSGYPQFIEFVRAYLNYLENEHGSGYYQNTLPHQRDVREQDTEFLHQIEKEIGLYVPRKFQADPKVFYDRISDLWKAKGSEDAVRTFFHLFLDDPVSIYYPWNQVLIPSDGRWVVDDRLRISIIQGDPNDLVGQTIQQIESLAEGKVDRIERRVYADGEIYELNLTSNSVIGEFVPRSRVRTTDGSVVGEVYRSVSDLTILSGGTGYELGDRIRAKGFEGFTFTAYVSAVDENGAINNVRFSNYGAGNTPTHVKQNNTTEVYYLRDFLIYRYADDVQVGPSEVSFEIDTESGTGADFEIQYSGIVTTDGEYEGVRGQLDESIVLQDSEFYQKFAYEVTTNYPSRIWIDALKRTVHPGGMAVFGNIRLSDVLDNSIDDSTIFTAITEPPKYILTEKPRIESRPLGFSQDYAEPSDVHFAEAYAGIEYFNRLSEPYTQDTSEYFASDYLGSEYYDIVIATEDRDQEFVREVSVIQD